MTTIGIVYTESARTPNLEFISDKQIHQIDESIKEHGWESAIVQYRPESIANSIVDVRPNAILNLAYGYRSLDGTINEAQPQSARRLERLGCNCVGASAESQEVAQDKVRTGEVLHSAGIRAPRVLSVSEWCSLRTVAVLKPRYGGCHRGVTLLSSSAVLRLGGGNMEEFVIQEYVDGDEYTVGVIEREGRLDVLPPIKMNFNVAPSEPHILVADDFSWDYEFQLVDRLGLCDLARAVFTVLELRDYARIDLRVDQQGPVVLDVNALPNLDPEISLLPMSARAAGISYSGLIATLIDSALRRGQRNISDLTL